MTNEYKPRILLIDDDRHAHEWFQNMHEDHYQLHSAYDGEAGLLRAVECVPDLILLDVMMPGTDGLTACGNLRAHPRVCDIPIIMLTALDDQETRLKCMREGADEFLTKPFNELEMTLRLRNLLQVNRYRQLLNERGRTQWLLNNAQEAFLVLDDQLNIEYANHRACALLGLSQPVGIGEPVNFQLAVWDFHSEPRALWDEWLANPRSDTKGGLHLLRPASPTSPAISISMCTHVHFARDRASILVRLKDITAAAKAQLHRWSFHHHVSHKLFTPLTGLKAGLEMMEETAAGKLDSIEIDALQVAMTSTARLLSDCRKVVDYLDLSSGCPPAGSFAIKNLSALCGEIWSACGIRMAVCDLHAKLWEQALAMPEITLTAILAELTVNSRKFSPAGPPQITLRVEPSTKGRAIFRFSDTGSHIPPEQLADVWRPHFQAERSFTGSVPGMGLGLPSVALQVWHSGGTFAIQNNDVGAGVTVTLEIPLAKPAVAEESQLPVAIGF